MPKKKPLKKKAVKSVKPVAEVVIKEIPIEKIFGWSDPEPNNEPAANDQTNEGTNAALN